MLIEVLTWWAARMKELLPARFTAGASQQGSALLVVADAQADGATRLIERRNGAETDAGWLDAGSVQPAGNGRKVVLLRPPRGAMLEKQVEVPLAAEHDLHSLIGYEMSRLTPFEAEDLFWTCAITRRDRVRDRLQLRLSLVPKAAVSAAFQAAERAGLAPSAIETLAVDGTVRRIPLHPETKRNRAARGLAIACGLLAMVAVALPFVLQSFAFASLDARVAALRPSVEEAQALRKRLAAEVAGQDAISQQAREVGDTLNVLAALTRLLPDDTFLNDLALHQRRLTITGQSAAAAKLVPLLASDPVLQNPGFGAPVTRNVAADRDVFSIVAEVAP